MKHILYTLLLLPTLKASTPPLESDTKRQKFSPHEAASCAKPEDYTLVKAIKNATFITRAERHARRADYHQKELKIQEEVRALQQVRALQEDEVVKIQKEREWDQYRVREYQLEEEAKTALKNGQKLEKVLMQRKAAQAENNRLLFARMTLIENNFYKIKRPH